MGDLNLYTGTGASEKLLLLLVFGIILCSLLCIFAALRNGGEILQNTSLMLLCQAFLLLAAMIQLGITENTLFSRVVAMIVFALGVAPIVLKKKSFQGARYCIAGGAFLAACMLFLL